MLINLCIQMLDVDIEAEEGATKAVDSSKTSTRQVRAKGD